MENDSLIVTIVAIVAVVGIVALVLAMGTSRSAGSVSLPSTVSSSADTPTNIGGAATAYTSCGKWHIDQSLIGPSNGLTMSVAYCRDCTTAKGETVHYCVA